MLSHMALDRKPEPGRTSPRLTGEPGSLQALGPHVQGTVRPLTGSLVG